jgi:predicted PurR-regulated permease PerM
MNGLLVFISLLGGLRVFGSLGLVLGPTLVAIGIGLIRTFTLADDEMAAQQPPS